MKNAHISKATLGRLPQYLQYLKKLPKGTEYISATVVAKELELGEVQVRKDLRSASGEGRPKVGYVTADLIKSIESYLGGSMLTEAVLVGAGRLGRALMAYDGFEGYGVKIEAAFDSNVDIADGSSKSILPMEKFDSFCGSHDVKIGIITVGADSAQTVCDRMIKNGIKAIWNFAPCKLKIPEGILLRQEDLAVSLAHLNCQVSN